MTQNITTEDYAIAQAYAKAGNYKAGWEYLALCGDRYADNAAAVTSGNTTGIDKAFEILVQKHWASTAGADAYAEKFDAVAAQHFQQYVGDIGKNNGRLPDTQQIEESYRKAVIDAGLPPTTAIDGVITRSVGDATGNFFDWPDGLSLENERVVPSSAFTDIEHTEAAKIIAQDFWELVQELEKQNLVIKTGMDFLEQIKKAAVRAFLRGAFGLGDAINSFEKTIGKSIDKINQLLRDSASYRIVYYDPLVLDLNGNGIETVASNGMSGALFDLNNDGIRTATGWIGSNDGILVRDVNGNGTIDNGTEVFGDSTNIANGFTASNGFTALANMDSNGDGVVDAQDANFAQLQVWRDLNQNGVSDAGELFTLQQVGVQSLNTAITTTPNAALTGGVQAQTGSFTKTDGTTSTLADINLTQDSFHSRYIDQIAVPTALQNLPNIQGMGRLRDLQVGNKAMNDSLFKIRVLEK